MYRLYIDEVGTDCMTGLENDRQRYLSLTGVILTKQQNQLLQTKFNELKVKYFNQDPDEPVIFHRVDIKGGKKHFKKIREDKAFAQNFENDLLEVINNTHFSVITAFIDKQELSNKAHWEDKEPYHYLMSIILEKYTQFLQRKRAVGDIVPEARHGPDKKLQKAFEKYYNCGTLFIKPNRIKRRIPSSVLKFRKKSENLSGLQLCDIVAHPSHMYMRYLDDETISIGNCDKRIINLLYKLKYDRSYDGRINGYGYKKFSAKEKAG